VRVLASVLLLALLASPAFAWSLEVDGRPAPLTAPPLFEQGEVWLPYGPFLESLRLRPCWPAPGLLELVGRQAVLAFNLVTGEVTRDGRPYPGRPARRAADGTVYLPLSTLAAAFGFTPVGELALASPPAPEPPPARLALHLLGRAVLVVAPGGEAVLFDAGPEVTPARLRDLGVHSLKLLVLTRAEPGRTENLLAVARAFPPAQFREPGYGPAALRDLPPGYLGLLEEVAFRGIAYALARAGQRLEPVSGLEVEFFSPAGFSAFPGRLAAAAVLRWGQVSFLLAGSLDAEAFRHLAGRARSGLEATLSILPPGVDPLALAPPLEATFLTDGVTLERGN